MVEIWKLKGKNALILHNDRIDTGEAGWREFYAVWIDGREKARFNELGDAYASLQRSYPDISFDRIISDRQFDYADYEYAINCTGEGTFALTQGSKSGHAWLYAGDYTKPAHRKSWDSRHNDEIRSYAGGVK